MATLNTSNGQFAQTFTVNQQSGSYILLSTANKYVDKDIKITTNVKLATSAADTATANTTLFTTDGSNAGVNIGAVSGVVGTKATTEPTSGYYIAITASASGNSKITDAGWIAVGSLTAATASQTQYYPIQSGAYSTSGGGLTANTGYANITTNAYYSGGAYDNTDLINVSSQTTDTEGYYKITVEGYGNVKRAAIKKTASKAGYIPANTSGTQTSAATNLNSNKAYANLFIKKSTLTSSSITPSTSAQTVTISEGYYPSDRTISIGAMATTTVTTSYDNSGMSTYFDSLSSSSGASVTITPKYSNSPAGYLAAHTTATGNGGVGYWKIKTTTRSAGAGSVTLTAGNGVATFAVGNGDSASTNNTSLAFTDSPPSAGAYYTLTITGKGTVSGTGKGTVSTGTGWVTSGSTTSNASASSSKDSNIDTIYRYIMKSVPGSAVSNALPSSISGRTAGTYEDIEIQPKGYIKIPAGYNPTDKYIFANVADASGESRAASGYSLSVSSISGSSDVIVGTTKTNNKYPVTANNISVTATLSASTAGWFSSGSATDSDTDSVTVGYVNEAVISGSSTNATATTTVAPGTVTIGAGADVSGKTKVAITPTTATTGITTYYIPIKATAAANSTGTTSAISGSGTAIVSTAGYAPDTLTGSITVSGTATAKTSSKDSSNYYIPLPTASGAWAAGTTVAAKATPGITNTNNIATVASPSGTAGTDYWTLTPTIASSTAGTYKAKYNYSSSGQGWVPNSLALTDGTARSVSVTAQTGTAIHIPKAVFSTTAGVTTITSAGYLPVDTVVTNLATVTPAFDGGALTSKGASATGTNATLETTNNSGISILAKGTAGRAAVLYNGAVNGYVNVADNTTASAAVASSTWNGTTYYLKNVTLPKDKTFAVTTSADTALDTTSDLDITNAAYRRVDITNATNGTVLIANSGNSTVTSGSATAGNLSVNAYDNASTPTLSGAKTIVSNGKWVTTSVSASGTYYGKVTVGTATLGSEGSVTTAPSVAVTNSTTMVTTTTNTGYSFTVGGTATNGTVQTKYKATTAGYTPVISATNGGTVTVTPGVTGGKTVYIQAAAGSVTMSKGNGSCVLQTSSNVTTSDTNTSGVSVTFRGSGAVSATAKITTAGYTPTNTSFATGSSTTSNTADLTKYITGVTLTKGKSFSITVPNGALNSDGTNNDTITFVFTVANDNTGNVTIAGPD